MIDAVMNLIEAAEQLAALRQQQELLIKLVEQQEQVTVSSYINVPYFTL